MVEGAYIDTYEFYKASFECIGDANAFFRTKKLI
jgi:hypothetical protein